MVDLHRAPTESDAFEDELPFALARTKSQRRGPADVLAALAILDPAASLDALLDPISPGAAAIDARALSRVISFALDAFGVDGAMRDAYGRRILRRYHDRLSRTASLDVASAIATFEDEADRTALDALLLRFPSDAVFLRIALRAEQRHGTPERLDALLTRLGLADPTLATVGFVHRTRPVMAPSSALTTARIAFVSSFTIDSLVPYVDLACRENGIVPQTYVAPFNSWTRDLIDPASGLRAFVPDLTFLSIALDDLVPSLAGEPGADDLARAADSALQRVLAAVDGYLAWSAGRPLVLHAFHSAFASPLGILDGADAPSRADWLAALNARLAEALRTRPGCHLLDIAATVAVAGGSLADDPKLRHIAGMRLGPAALAPLAQAYARYIVPARGLAKKCVVLDLDNTLWGGVVGEDGKDGIRLATSGAGAEFVEFQTFLQSLARRGILLAINSKNNPDDALDVIRTHAAMVLRESSFSAVRINWLPKSENMLAIARELNIGVDSLVFVDDNPDERERMRQMLPDVQTVELPRDPTRYRATLERLPQLQSLAITSEDRERLDLYRTARVRAEARSENGNVESYLRSLEIAVTIAPADATTLARVAQLFAKTNQFNLTTQRYTLADVTAFAANPTLRLWTLVSKDRFGDHGLVAVALVRTAPEAWQIDSFLMSCRVIGYGIEAALLAHIAESARSAGAARIYGDVVETNKNAPARDLYERHGFALESEDVPTRRWTRPLTTPLPSPAWIERTI